MPAVLEEQASWGSTLGLRMEGGVRASRELVHTGATHQMLVTSPGNQLSLCQQKPLLPENLPAPRPSPQPVGSPYLTGIPELMEAASTDHAGVEMRVEADAFPAAVDGDFGFKELVGCLVVINQAPPGYAALGARGEVAAGLGQWNGLDVVIESGLCCQLGESKVFGEGYEQNS